MSKELILMNADKPVLQFNLDDYIYLSNMKSSLGFTDKEVYDLVHLMVQDEILDLFFILYCPYCDHYIGEYHTFGKMVKSGYCGDCDREFNPLEHAIVAFKARL